MIRIRLFVGLIALAFVALVSPKTVYKALEERFK
jgi:Flp pilus assembly pilin Flp